MSNKLPPSFKDTDQQKQAQQAKMQQQAMVLQTRLRLSENFLNTMIGRVDIDLTDQDLLEPMVNMSIDFANTLMIKLGMIVIETKGVE